MLTQDDAKASEQLPYKEETVRRKQFIERMELKLAYKAAAQRQRRQQFRTRLARMRTWQ
jgi:hypothetical protein